MERTPIAIDRLLMTEDDSGAARAAFAVDFSQSLQSGMQMRDPWSLRPTTLHRRRFR